jgi:uncharacterized protein (DUF3820 family)
MKMTKVSRTKIIQACREVNIRDPDCATLENAVGFNKPDSSWFKYRLIYGDELPDEEIFKMYVRVEKYKAQLLEYGIDYNDLLPDYIEMNVSESSIRFPFGKYRGQKIEDVAVKDPKYIRWVIRTVDNQKLVFFCRLLKLDKVKRAKNG